MVSPTAENRKCPGPIMRDRHGPKAPADGGRAPLSAPLAEDERPGRTQPEEERDE